MKRALAASTPDIGFYGEEGGGAALDTRPRVGRRPAGRDDQLRDRLAAVRGDARAARGRRARAGRDRPAVPGRARGPAARWPTWTRSTRGSSRVGDAFHRGGPRMDAFLELAVGDPPARAALPLRRRGRRCCGRGSPAARSRACCSRTTTRTTSSPATRSRARRARWSPTTRARRSRSPRRGAMAAVPGHPRRARRAGGRPRRGYLGGSADARVGAAVDPVREHGVVGSPSGSTSTKPFIGLAPGRPNSLHVRLADRVLDLFGRQPHDQAGRRASRRRPCCRRSSSPRPPNILRSTTPGRAWMRSRMRAASRSS